MPEPDAQATEPADGAAAAEDHPNVEVEALKRELEALRVELDVTRGTLTARETDLANATQTLVRDSVARETGVKAELLKGETREELEAHADAIHAFASAKQRGGYLPRRQSMSGTAAFDNAPLMGARERAAMALREL